MSATVRTITADCTSGDGSVLIISTLGQDEGAALRFTVKRVEDGYPTAPTAVISWESLRELIGFQNLESARYAADWVTADDDTAQEIF